MSQYIPKALKQQIRTRDRGYCRYCQTSEQISGIPHAFDHIQPRSKQGNTDLENLCLSCRSCNEFKSDLTQAIDPLTSQLQNIFHPLQQQWSQHFTWDTAGTHIVGLTACGRATVMALRMNNPAIIAARQRWVAVGWHPPNP